MDAFIALRDSLYLFTKNRTDPFTGYTRIYRLPSHPGQHVATLYDSLFLGTGPMMEGWITGADVSPDGEWLALLSHDRLWLVHGFNDQKFSHGLIHQVDLGHFSHKTGISFATNTMVYLIDEREFGFLGGKIYRADLAPVMKAILSASAARTGRHD